MPFRFSQQMEGHEFPALQTIFLGLFLSHSKCRPAPLTSPADSDFFWGFFWAVEVFPGWLTRPASKYCLPPELLPHTPPATGQSCHILIHAQGGVFFALCYQPPPLQHPQCLRAASPLHCLVSRLFSVWISLAKYALRDVVNTKDKLAPVVRTWLRGQVSCRTTCPCHIVRAAQLRLLLLSYKTL